jgi:hypothetical protein
MKTIARALLISLAVLTISLSWANWGNAFMPNLETASTWDAIDAVETSTTTRVSHRAQALKSAMMTGTLSCTSDVDQNGIPLEAYLNVGLITGTLTCTIFLDAGGFDITEFAWPLACEGAPLDFFWPGYSTYSYTSTPYEITGDIMVDPFGVHTYSYPSNPNSVYLWLVDGGSIISGQGTSNVAIVWGEDGYGYLGVVEVLDGICPGELVSDMILIGNAASVDMVAPAHWSTYPSPADATINLESDLYQNQCEVKLFDFSGRVCHQGVMSGKRYTIDTGSLAEGVYILYAGRSAHKVVIKR